MELNTIAANLRDERSRLKERLRRIESTLLALEKLESDPLISEVTGSKAHRLKLKEQILGVLNQSTTGYLTPRQVADLIGSNNGTVGVYLSKMPHRGEIHYVRGMGYQALSHGNLAAGQV